MISLIFIPLLFWYFGNAALKNMNVAVLDFGLRAKEKKGEPVPEYYRIAMEDWTYKPVNVKPNLNKDDVKNFENLINEMAAEKIPKTGIRFQFSDQNNYGDLVKILNILLKTKQEVYGLDIDDTNSLYVLYDIPVLSDDFIGCGTMPEKYYDQADYDYRHASFYTKVMKYSTKETYFLIFGFLLLVYASMLKLTI